MSSVAPPNVRSQVTQFTDQDPGWGAAIPSVMDGTRDVAYSDNTSLGEFLQRPISIWRQTWTSGSSDTNKVFVFDPWYLYLSNAQIQKKISTYKLIQGSLCVKFIINANGFSYGCMMAYYHPLQYQDTTAGYPSITVVNKSGSVAPHGTFTSATNELIVRHSQKPHIFLMPQTSTGGTLKLPFLWPENWLDLTGGNADKLGKIFLYQLNPLKSLTVTNTARVSITAYAWMEDAKLSLSTTMEHALYYGGPTATDYSIAYSWPDSVPKKVRETPSSSKKVAVSHSGDEYGTGPVSKVANSIAIAADSLSSIPTIGPYARASSLVATGVGKVASLFGFSRPTVVTDITPYKPIYFGNLANTDAGDTSQKLTLDSKQEVSVDPRVVGLPPTDEMSIHAIAGRESYYQTFVWKGATGTSSTDYQAGKRLMNCLITPLLFRKKTNSDVNKIQHNLTGCCYAALPFGAWRGTMRFRFQIIASQFHRGRIRVVWDPRKIVEQGTGILWETSNIMSCIVDLAENRDFTVDIGWGRTTTYCTSSINPGNNAFVENSVYVSGSADANSTIKDEFGNGVIGVYIVNELVATTTGTNSSLETPEAYINMFVSCPDLDVANPEEGALQKWSVVEPHGLPTVSAQNIADSHAGFEEVEPEHKPVSPGAADFCLGPPVPKLDSQTSSVFYGDPIVSIRTLMKRYCFHMAQLAYHVTNTANTQSETIIYQLPDYPQTYGTAIDLWAPSYMGITPSDAPAALDIYGWCPAKTSWLSFYSPAFACRRGGIRWKYVCKNTDKASTSDDKYVAIPPTLTVTRGTWPKPSFQGRVTTHEAGRYEKIPIDYSKNFPTGEGGLFITNTDGNPVVEVELPFYNLYRFLTTKQADYKAQPGDQYERQSNQRNLFSTHSLTCVLSGSQNNAEPILSYVAAADDYSLYMYLGPPLLYYIDSRTDMYDKLLFRYPYQYLPA